MNETDEVLHYPSAFLCVDKYGQEFIFDKKPILTEHLVWKRLNKSDCYIILPKGTIERITDMEK